MHESDQELDTAKRETQIHEIGKYLADRRA